MENRNRFAILGVAASIVGVLAIASPAHAQNREARGTVTSVTDTSLTMKAGAEELTVFVIARPIWTYAVLSETSRRNSPGIRVPASTTSLSPDKPCWCATVWTRVETWRLISARISSAGGEGSISNPAKISAGKVKLVNASQLVIEDGGRELSFGVTGDTNVLAKGATKATKAAGGSTPITTFVHTGDTVSVSYHEAGAKMMASEVRVTVASR